MVILGKGKIADKPYTMLKKIFVNRIYMIVYIITQFLNTIHLSGMIRHCMRHFTQSGDCSFLYFFV